MVFYLKRKKLFLITRDMIGMYGQFHVSRAAAALSYFLTLTVFPLMICLYTMLRRYVTDIDEIIGFLDGIIPAEALDTIADFMLYVTSHSGRGLFIAAIFVMVTSSSAAFRGLYIVFSEMQGKGRFRGIFFFIFSFFFSVVFLIIMYFAAIVIITGDWFLKFVGSHMPMLDVAVAWKWLRFVLLFAVLILVLSGIYGLSAPKGTEKHIMAGALSASVALVAISVLFSCFIGMSTKYSLIYGSLASIIIMMFWLYICAIVIIMGNALNIVLRRMSAESPQPDDRAINTPKKANTIEYPADRIGGG